MSLQLPVAAAGAAVIVVIGAVTSALALGQDGVAPPHLTPPQLLTQPIAGTGPAADQLRRGQYLVRAGDCAACHTPAGGPPFAGGLPLNTPFGAIYSTNLTSDLETGIGRASPAIFYRALHQGIGPRGGPIYPAMPYNYFTRITRADSDDMLAYLKTTPAVSARRPANRLAFPFNIRTLVRGWNLLFFREGGFMPDPGKSTAWNRGAYLVTGAGHCGSCHTPKNFLAADKAGQALHGGRVDNWLAPDLTANNRTGIGRWSEDDVVEYLKTGRNAYANAGAAMSDVVTNSTSLLADTDLRAVAVYLKDQPATPQRASAVGQGGALERGAAIYSDACASCHMDDGAGQPRFFPPLAGNAGVQQRDPSTLIRLILGGSRTAPTAARPSALAMPSFAWKLNDQQVADLSTFVRSSWGNAAAPVSARQVAGQRRTLGLTQLRLSDGSGDHPPLAPAPKLAIRP